MSFDEEPPSLLHPREIIARTPIARTASSRIEVSRGGSSMTMLPKPIYTGGGPSRRNASSSEDGEYIGNSRKKKPQTSRYLVGHNTERLEKCTDVRWPILGFGHQGWRPAICEWHFKSLHKARPFGKRNPFEINGFPPVVDHIAKSKHSRLDRCLHIVNNSSHPCQVIHSTTPYETAFANLAFVPEYFKLASG